MIYFINIAPPTSFATAEEARQWLVKSVSQFVDNHLFGIDGANKLEMYPESLVIVGTDKVKTCWQRGLFK